MKIGKINYLLSGSFLALMMCPDVAIAQEEVDQQAAGSGGLGVIVVTAQKSQQDVQDTAAAVTTYDGDTLVQRGVVDIQAAQNIVPSARFQQQGASTEIYIRGVGSTLDLAHIEPPTSFNVNGIYIPREGTAVPFFDIERLEVLPGPQGTLYGRSSLGGAVNVSFQRPSQQLESRGLIEVGNYDLIHASLAQNIPVSNDFAVRVAGDYTWRDGYMESGANSQNDLAVRLSALYEPETGFSAYLWGYYATRNGNSPNLVNKGLNPTTFQPERDAFLQDDPWDESLPPQFAFFGQPTADDLAFENWVFGAEFNTEIGDVTLTYIPSYFHLESMNNYWITGLPTILAVEYEQTTHELRLAGNSDRLNWIAGLYGYRLVSNGLVNVAGTPVSNIDRNRLQGFAAFGQLSFSVVDDLRIIAGARFSVDDRVGRGRSLDVNGQPTVPFTADANYDRIDFKLGLEYDATPDVMLYAVVQSGYQPGTFNEAPSTPTFDNLVDPARLTAYTAGIKSRFSNDNVQVNSEFFYYDYSNLFAQAFNASAGITQIFNAEKVEIFGNQTDIIARPFEDGQLNFSIGYLHAENQRFVTPNGADFAGFSLQYAPRWTVSAGYEHNFAVGRGNIRARFETRYESHFYGDFLHSFGTRQQGYIKSNAAITYFSEDERWSLGIWIRNIENEAVQAATASGGLPGPAAAYLEPPRTFGLRASFNF